MAPNIRKSVRILLLNDENQLLLMRVEGLDICSPNGKRHNNLWCTIGGGIENEEAMQEAALREMQEETGIAPEEVTIGSVVWHSSFELIYKGTLTRLNETFVVAHTKKREVALHSLTANEKEVVKELKWFSLDEIKQCTETIFPVNLAHHLPDILAGKYPAEPICIDQDNEEAA